MLTDSRSSRVPRDVGGGWREGGLREREAFACVAVGQTPEGWSSSLSFGACLHLRQMRVRAVDFGDSRTLVSAVVEWELPAMAYSVQLSSDGSSWTDAFATDVNGLFTNRVYLGYASASKLRLVRLWEGLRRCATRPGAAALLRSIAR